MDKPQTNPYLREAVMTATPEQLQLMLYDGAIRFALQGKEALENKNFEVSYEKLTRAQNIILEMQKGLNFDVNPDLCQRVSAIYTFLYNKLVDANVQHDPASIEDALRVLRIERETWQILVDKLAAFRQSPDAEEPAMQPAEQLQAVVAEAPQTPGQGESFSAEG